MKSWMLIVLTFLQWRWNRTWSGGGREGGANWWSRQRGVCSFLWLIAGSHFDASRDIWVPWTMTCLPSLWDEGGNLVPTGNLLSDHQSAPSRTVEPLLAAGQEKQNSCSRASLWFPSSKLKLKLLLLILPAPAERWYLLTWRKILNKRLKKSWQDL